MSETRRIALNAMGETTRLKLAQCVVAYCKIGAEPQVAIGSAFRTIESAGKVAGERHKRTQRRDPHDKNAKRAASQNASANLAAIARTIDAARFAVSGKERREARKALHDRFLR